MNAAAPIKPKRKPPALRPHGKRAGRLKTLSETISYWLTNRTTKTLEVINLVER